MTSTNVISDYCDKHVNCTTRVRLKIVTIHTGDEDATAGPHARLNRLRTYTRHPQPNSKVNAGAEVSQRRTNDHCKKEIAL
jgi:hypothetical protein